MSNDKEKVTRKLKAILSADVKGYSLLMAVDESFTLRKLDEYRTRMANLIKANSGNVVDAVGDNLLAEFSSAVDAVRCAVQIQNALEVKNKELPDDKRLYFRIGIHIGDVIQDKERIVGSGVNVAARVEGLADPGGVCISNSVYEQIKGKLEFGYRFLGEKKLKNISDPVGIYSVMMDPKDKGKLVSTNKRRTILKWSIITIVICFVVASGVVSGLYWKYLYIPTPTGIETDNRMAFELPKGPTIAVLPFDNMTGDPDNDSFCDGLADILLSTLSYVQDLQVIARNSSFTYRGKQTNVMHIGDELNAEWLVEGSVQKADKRIRITVQLINTTSGYHKWSETYDREFDKIFQLQDEIVQNIVQAIGEKLVWGGAGKNALDGINSLKELTLLAEAISNWDLETIEGTHKAQEILLELIEINPSIPMAHVALSSTYAQGVWFDTCKSTTVCMAKAFASLKKAFSLNQNFDFAHVVAGSLYLMMLEHEKAISYYEAAIALNPNNAIAYRFLGEALIFYGKPEEAIIYLKKALSLNPKPNHNFYHSLGFAYQDMGEFEKAIESYNKCLSLNPDNVWTYVGLVIVYGHMEKTEKAGEAIDELFKLNPNFTVNSFLNTIMPYKYDKSRNFLREGFQKAGLKDDE